MVGLGSSATNSPPAQSYLPALMVHREASPAAPKGGDCATPVLLGGTDAGVELSVRFNQIIGFLVGALTTNNEKVAYHFGAPKCT